MNVRGPLSTDEIRSFLAEATIPVRLACQTPSGTLWMVSLWYRCRSAGDDAADWVLQCATGTDADVVAFLREHEGVAFEISSNHPPYRGVRGRGTAAIEPDPEKETLRDLLERYLGGTDSPLARNLLREDREEVTITIDPAVVSTWDYTDRMGRDE
ncbi:pyridoxamine 5'-phosphate oxidase family protein [Halosolutus amylolyticus]|uniref:Pyridoxamine 5'-phosphate oxidase family protein n=1 Tax=Halosolutus amylolyticus TaxID=2932267 RepID=A0ABD5PVR6_9EURY|nr:pyridoxamine 5'-phosphate oxidase family protein [Halosolutus amylolyticus]